MSATIILDEDANRWAQDQVARGLAASQAQAINALVQRRLAAETHLAALIEEGMEDVRAGRVHRGEDILAMLDDWAGELEAQIAAVKQDAA